MDGVLDAELRRAVERPVAKAPRHAVGEDGGWHVLEVARWIGFSFVWDL